MEAKLPETVPVLTADQMFRGDYDGPDGRHCLVGWMRETGFAYTLLVRGGPYDAILRVGNEMTNGDHPLLSILNDESGLDESGLAKVWNAAMKRLGYVRRGKQFVLAKSGK